MAIEAGQLTEKDELIGKFYAVRAGLSVIADENAKIRRQEEEISTKKSINSSSNQTTSEKYQRDLETFNSKKDRLEEELEKSRLDEMYGKDSLKHNGGQKEIIEKTWAYKFRNKIEGKVGKFGTLFLFWFLIGLFGGFFVRDESIFVAILVGYWVVMILAVFLGGLLSGAVNKSGELKKLKQEMLKDETRISNAQNKVKCLEKELEAHLETEPNKNEYVLDVYLPSIRAMEKERDEKIIPESTSRAKAIRNGLLEVTDGILVEEDWANVDLLIFYLKTGRANSLQDALLLVDKQRQTEQITQAISSASEYVCNTIQDTTTKMAQFLASALGSLSEQIQRNHRELISELDYTRRSISGAISDMSSNVGALGRQINSSMSELNSNMSTQNQVLISSNEINRALLDNANNSSQQLMNELRYNQNLWRR